MKVFFKLGCHKKADFVLEMKGIRGLLIPAAFYLLTAVFVFRELFLKGGIWNYGDSSFPMDPGSMDYLMESIKAVWWNRNFLGYDTTFQTIHSSSFILAWKFLYAATGDFSAVQSIWYVVMFTAGSLSMYGLTYFFLNNRLASFSSGLLYVLNPLAVERLIVVPLYQAYVFIPALFLFYALYLSRRKFIYMALFAASAFFIISSLHYTFYSALIIAFYAFFLVLGKKRADLKGFATDNLKLILFTVLVLAFYTLPMAYSFIAGDGGTAAEAIRRFSSGSLPAFHYGRDLTIAKALRLLGYHDSFYGAPAPWFGQASYLLPVFLIAPFVFREKKPAILYFFYLMAITGIFLSASPHILGEKLYRLLLLNIPVVKTLASLPDPYYHSFLQAFSYGPIIGYGLSRIAAKLKERSGARSSRQVIPAFAVFFAVFAATLSYPAFKWDDYRHSQFEYPKEYLEAAAFLRERAKGSRVLVWPPDHAVKHSWAPYFVCNLDKFIFNVDTFGSSISEATPQWSLEFMKVLRYFVRDKDAFLNLLRVANVKYIVFMRDAESAFFHDGLETEETAYFLDAVNSSAGIKTAAVFGDVSVYSLEDGAHLPLFYAPEKAYCNGLGDAVTLKGAGRARPVFVSGEKIPESISFASAPEIGFKRMDSTRYEVYVKKHKGPFMLVFSQSFNENWRAYIAGGSTPPSFLPAGGKEVEGHLMVNGYANAWLIDGEQGPEFTVVVEYAPQRFYRAGISLTLFSSASAIAYLGLSFIVRRRRGHGKS